MPEKRHTKSVLDILVGTGNFLLPLLSGLLAAFLILYSGYVLYDTFYTQGRAFNSSWDLLAYRPEIIDDGAVPLSGQDKLAQINEDYRGWLTVYQTNIDYPVMQGPDDLYYSAHDIYKESSLTGAIYLAAANSPDFSDDYNLIYGHHMDNTAMFGALDRFEDIDYFNEHREGVIVSRIGVYDLYTFAVINTDAYEKQVYLAGDGRLGEVLEFLRNPTGATTVPIFDEEPLAGATKIVALSTCADATTNGRLIVFAVMTQRDLITLTVEGYDGVYDAAPHGLESVKASIAKGTVIQFSTDGVNWSTTMPTLTHVGETVVYIRADNEYYGHAETSAVIRIAPAPVTVRAADCEKVYGGPDPAFTATVTEVPDNFQITYTITRAGDAQNAGTYPDAIVPAGEARQGDYIVTFVPGSLTIRPAGGMSVSAGEYNGVYDAKSHSGSASANISAGTTLKYRVIGADGKPGDWTTEPPAITDVGSITYEVQATNPNYNTATSRAVLTVTPAPVTVSANDAVKSAGDPDPAFTATVSGVLDNYNILYTVTRSGRDESVGVYADVVVPTGDTLQGNYSVTYVPASLTITRAGELALALSDYEGVYDGKEHAAQASVNITQGTTIEYSIDGVQWTTVPPAIKDVGSLTVYVRATNNNYDTVSGTLTMKVTPAPVTITADNARKPYGAEDPQFNVTISGMPDDFDFVYTVQRIGGDEDAGLYRGVIVPTGNLYQGNYAITFVPGDFVIDSGDGDIELSVSGFDGVYDGERHTGSVNTNMGVVTYSIDGGKTWTDEIPFIRDAGETEVLVRVDAPNYRTAETSFTLRIRPKAVTVTALDAEKLFGEDDPVFTAVVEGLVGGDRISFTVTRPGAGQDEDVGVYYRALVPSGAARQGNYSVYFITGAFTILENENIIIPPPDDDIEPPPDKSTDDPDVPIIDIFKPRPWGRGAWALVNLICLILTAYIFLPLLHLKAKYGRARMMKRINNAKKELRILHELEEKQLDEKHRINLLAAEERAWQEEGATEESVKAAVEAAEKTEFADVTEEDFDSAVDKLYYQVVKFLRRFRVGIISEIIITALAIIAFILTEDMRLPMVLIDKWTPLMILLMALCLVVDIRLARYRSGQLAEEQEELDRQIKQAEENLQNNTPEQQ